MRRSFICLVAVALLAGAIWRIPHARAFQGAVAHSLPGHEDLTFWVNHNGLSSIDVEGEVGFGDMARILMRRRANAPHFRTMRDRFVFKSREFAGIQTPDLTATRFVIAQNRIFNVPVIAGGKGFFHKVFETRPGTVTRTVGDRNLTFDVRPLHKLKVRILDERSQPSHARVYLTAADGLAYAPAKTIHRYASEAAEPFFHAPPEFEIELPAGKTELEATRGIEYELVRAPLDLRRDTAVTIRLKRWINMAARGWHSSDAHIHANYTAPHHQVVTPADVLTYTLAEDLNIPNMMVANSSGAFLHDKDLFEGKPHRLSRPNYVLWWNEEMRNAGQYGHMCLYNLKQLAEPLFTGFRGTQYEDDYPANYNQAEFARAQGGAVTYAHPGYAPAFEGASCRELPVDLALGAIDAMDVFSNNPEEVAMELWYRLLNAGFRLGISAGTDSFTNVADHYTPGGHRVYALTANPLRYEDWIAAYKQGRTFATNGPMLFLKINGQDPGSELNLPAGRHRVKIDLVTQSHLPVTSTELVVNGKAISPVPKTLTLTESSWIAARTKGAWNRMVLNDGALQAHTSPVYVRIGGQAIANQADIRFWLEWIDKLIARTAERGRFSSEQRKQEVLGLFRKGRGVVAARLATR